MKFPEKKNLLRRLPAALMLLLMLGSVVYFLCRGIPDIDGALAFIRAHSTVAVLILLALFAAKGISAVLPYSWIVTLTGLLFDLVPAQPFRHGDLRHDPLPRGKSRKKRRRPRKNPR